MLNFIGKIKKLRQKLHGGMIIRISACFCIVIQNGKIYLIYKPHKESVVKIGNIKF